MAILHTRVHVQTDDCLRQEIGSVCWSDNATVSEISHMLITPTVNL